LVAFQPWTTKVKRERDTTQAHSKRLPPPSCSKVPDNTLSLTDGQRHCRQAPEEGAAPHEHWNNGAAFGISEPVLYLKQIGDAQKHAPFVINDEYLEVGSATSRGLFFAACAFFLLSPTFHITAAGIELAPRLVKQQPAALHGIAAALRMRLPLKPQDAASLDVNLDASHYWAYNGNNPFLGKWLQISAKVGYLTLLLCLTCWSPSVTLSHMLLCLTCCSLGLSDCCFVSHSVGGDVKVCRGSIRLDSGVCVCVCACSRFPFSPPHFLPLSLQQ
jgi:hypothetical protein